MARKKVILGQSEVSYSKAIKEITGWTQKQFETQKRLMRYRVANFNKATGSTLSPIEELYYRVKFEARQDYYRAKGKPVNDYNSLQQALKDIKTTQSKGGISPYQEKIARDYILKRYEGLGKAFKNAQNILDDLEAQKITPAEANKKLKAYADEMRQLKDEDPAKWVESHEDEFTISE